uniref:Glutamyl-tRNA reductase n=1 Tax=Gloeochaete wittrockiana TaxID=38269 RepID=A0A3G1IW04_9EUKA|nr:glutamyl-tRNA reductase [Gloeochaete wittrockiana]ASQ40203.1 glutamyl-tRNA reductase [Gloeochaete wittrockiana]
MNITVVGLSHKTAPIEFREKLSIQKTHIEKTIRVLTQYPHIEEIVILSTCNRLEIYALASDNYQGLREIIQFLSDWAQIPVKELRKYLFLLLQQDAIMHLLRVSAGLDSLVIGEGQILAQVKECYQLSQQYQGIGPVINHLLKQVISAGKKVRSSTQIGTGAVSISSAAVELAHKKISSLSTRKITVIGAGKMSRLLLQHLISKGVTSINLINRSVEKALSLKNQFENLTIDIYSLQNLIEVINKSEVVFTSTSSEEPILDYQKLHILENNIAKNGLACIDISVPRNINSNITNLKNVQLYNVDDLKSIVYENFENRKKIGRVVESLLEEELIAFNVWWASLDTIPTINKLREKAETIRIEELQKAFSKLDDHFTKRHQKTVETLTRGIVNKILHDPMVQLKAQPDIEARSKALKILQTLFNLNSIKKISPDI